MNIYDKNNLAATIYMFPHLFVGTEYGKTEDEVIKSAARLYEEAIKDNPNLAGAIYNLASIIFYNLRLFATTTQEEINQLKRAKGLLEKYKQIETNPEWIKHSEELIKQIKKEIKKRKTRWLFRIISRLFR